MTDGHRMAAILVAAGGGTRAGGPVPKQYRQIAGIPVLVHAVKALQRAGINRIQLVIGPAQESLLRVALAGLDLPEAVPGGETRRLSVRAGLQRVAAWSAVDRVLVHDAARPFLPSAVIDRLAGALERSPGAVPVLPVADTLARGEGLLGENMPRDGVVRVQTPQAFHLSAILDAHERWRGGEASDDAQMVRAAGYEVTMVAGDPLLDKLTHEADFARMELIAAGLMETRTGLGFDVHAFGPGDHVMIGGVPIPHDRGLIGHSDADVGLHALTDAILGAAALGDIGDHFPPSDPEWRGADSATFVEHALKLVHEAGGEIVHADLTLIAQAPRIGPHRPAIKDRLAGLLRVPSGSISVKATTTERLGFIGRGEGMAAQAVATLRLPRER